MQPSPRRTVRRITCALLTLILAFAAGTEDATAQRSPVSVAAWSDQPVRLSAHQQSRHLIGVGAGYLPGPGLSIHGMYEYHGLAPGPIVLALGWSEAIFGSAEYRLSLPLDDFGSRRLALTGGLFSEYFPNRLLDGSDRGETDERRSGVRVRAAFNLQPDGSQRFMSADLGAQHARVHLDRSEGGAETEIITVVDLGGVYAYRTREHMAEIEVAPRFRLGREERSPFFVALLTGSLRYTIAPPIDLVVESRASAISASTPRYERPSFGGRQTVRGYREDAAFGRLLWTLQNEVWMPIPGLTDAMEGPLGFAARHLRLAVFGDVGGIYGTIDLPPGIRTGVGAGVRLLLGGPVLRIDYAYGFDRDLPGQTGGSVYISLIAGVRP